MSNFERTCLAGLVYAKSGDEELGLDLYLPQAGAESSARPEGPFPVVVYIHGGGWVRGGKGSPSGVTFALEMAAEGLAVACIDYRKAPEHPAPAAIEDCKRAVRWLRANAAEHNLDPERVISMGNSAGGHLSAMLGLTRPEDGFDGEGLNDQDSSVMAAIDLCGIADVEELISDGSEREWAAAWIPEHLADRVDLARRCSPVNYARADAPPMLICHGDADPYVPHHQSMKLARKLERLGAPVEFKSLAGASHFLGITGPVEVQRAIREARRGFFSRLGLLRETVKI